MAALFNVLATGRSCRNICCFDQNYQSRNITLQVAVLIIKYLVAASFGQCNMCCIFKTLHYWLRDFLDKGLGIVPPAYFVYDFLTKMFLMLYSINWPISLPSCLYFSRYWAICAWQLFVKQVVTSWILKLTLAFRSSRFFYMTKT